MSLTERQQKIWDYIKKFTSEKGRSPNVWEIGAAVGITSSSVIKYNLGILQNLGLLHGEKLPSFGHGL